MSRRPPKACPATPGLARHVWLLRWLLVLLLAWDQIGSPLHQHHHDAGIAVHDLTAHAGAVHAPTALQADEADGDLDFTHAIAAVRPQFDARVVVAVTAEAAPFPKAVKSLAARAVVPPEDPRRFLSPDKVPPPYTSHRSLPPAGRAPPLHA